MDSVVCARSRSACCDGAVERRSRLAPSAACGRDRVRRALSRHAFATSRYNHVENPERPSNRAMPLISFRNTCCVMSCAAAWSPWKKCRVSEYTRSLYASYSTRNASRLPRRQDSRISALISRSFTSLGRARHFRRLRCAVSSEFRERRLVTFAQDSDVMRHMASDDEG